MGTASAQTGIFIVKSPASREATRLRILEAALRLFSRNGYLGATTREMAREAGVSEMTLFRHFPSKEALFEAVLSTHTFLPALKGIIPAIQTMPIEEALVIIARKYLETLDIRRDFIKIMLSECRFFPEKVHGVYRAFLAEIFSTLAAYFSERQKAGIMRPFDPLLGARAFLAMFFTYFLTTDIVMFQAREHSSVDKVIHEYVSFFLRGTEKKLSE
ncbi:MAG TPA: TetR/AcrR family transcriptional regulator [Dissulfurispiraceae bacterium]|nr:TetR/AcrR family transcriptional regulator [Dissulfurispiraceae bacterium]